MEFISQQIDNFCCKQMTAEPVDIALVGHCVGGRGVKPKILADCDDQVSAAKNEAATPTCATVARGMDCQYKRRQ